MLYAAVNFLRVHWISNVMFHFHKVVYVRCLLEMDFSCRLCVKILSCLQQCKKYLKIDGDFPELWSQMSSYLFSVYISRIMPKASDRMTGVYIHVACHGSLPVIISHFVCCLCFTLDQHSVSNNPTTTPSNNLPNLTVVKLVLLMRFASFDHSRFKSPQWRRRRRRKCNDLKCVRKPTKSRLSLTHHANKSSRWAEVKLLSSGIHCDVKWQDDDAISANLLLLLLLLWFNLPLKHTQYKCGTIYETGRTRKQHSNALQRDHHEVIRGRVFADIPDIKTH